MPTKDELLAFAADHGIDVMASASKTDVADALTAAGYDPDSIEEADTVPETRTTDDEPVSRQAQFSTYEEATDLPETNPPAGGFVYQTLGTPNDYLVTAFGKRK